MTYTGSVFHLKQRCSKNDLLPFIIELSNPEVDSMKKQKGTSNR